MTEGHAGVDVVVEGRVQGVGFRDFCVRCAEMRGVVGYAMNLDDGRVRVVAEGPRDALESFVRDLQRGPRLARVDQAIPTWRMARGQYTGFTIRFDGRDA